MFDRNLGTCGTWKENWSGRLLDFWSGDCISSVATGIWRFSIHGCNSCRRVEDGGNGGLATNLPTGNRCQIWSPSNQVLGRGPPRKATIQRNSQRTWRYLQNTMNHQIFRLLARSFYGVVSAEARSQVLAKGSCCYWHSAMCVSLIGCCAEAHLLFTTARLVVDLMDANSAFWGVAVISRCAVE